MNLYGFAHADPVNFSDPFGLNECEKIENSGERKTCEQDARDRQVQACEGAIKDLIIGGAIDGLTFGLGRVSATAARRFLSAEEVLRANIRYGTIVARGVASGADNVSDALALHADNSSVASVSPLRIAYDVTQFIPYVGTVTAAINTGYSCGKLLK